MHRLKFYQHAGLKYFSQVAQASAETISTQSATSSKKWEIAAALVLLRPTVVSPPMTELEKSFDAATERLEMMRSLKSNFELKREQDTVLMEQRKKLIDEGRDTVAVDESLRSSTYFQLDEWRRDETDLMERYHFHNLTSTESTNQQSQLVEKEQLDKKKLLLVRQKFAENTSQDYVSPWTLPHLKNDGVESLRQTAEKCLGNIVKDQISVQIYGNAPFAHHAYNYPRKLKERLNHDGLVFFMYALEITDPRRYKAIVWNRDVIPEHKWCTHEEVAQLLGCRKFFNSITHALIE